MEALSLLLKKSGEDNDHLRKLLDKSHEDNQKLQDMLRAMQAQLDKLQRMIFGQSSERQRGLQKKAEDNKATQESSVSPVAKDDNATRNGRKKLPIELPRRVFKHDFTEAEKQSTQCCQAKLQCIGKDVSEQLEFVPSSLYVIEHRRYKYSCFCCKTLYMAPMPEQPIDKGLAGPGLLAETLIAKYQDHMPLYRQEKRYERLGYSIARSTLCDWVDACADRLKPIVAAMHTDMLVRSPKIHSDDTIIPVLRKEKTHNGRLWVYVGGGGHAPSSIIYRYSKTRTGQEPKNFLGDYCGYLQADAYAGYDQCYESGNIIEVGCLAHARRKFIDTLKVVENDKLAQEAILYIKSLYEIEGKIKEMDAIQRYYYRRRYAKPRLKIFYRWLKHSQHNAPPKSLLGKAINYTLNHWKALNNYLRDGVLDIDNNAAERAMRSVVLGRKNYLFAGSDNGAENAAVIYSLIETCKALKINTFDYLTDVLKRLPTTLNSNITKLIPYNWKPVIIND